MESLQIAHEKGIAESDQSLDVKGFDSACKISLLANSAFRNKLLNKRYKSKWN